MGQVVEMFQPEHAPIQIQDSLPFDGRTVEVTLQDNGILVKEIIDEDEQTIYLSIAEINALLYVMTERK